ncbi:hypothetical protein [Candidatus Thiodictyon syntrophicum]|jgi:hypothetical protein|uniref:Uncharacterized protein n=1 Tax=Candidatus Thiodictyon syntrophicum TaxID=1166950 RepID=A0A2K8U3E2_9GAMM|nr:hypothetical protein [Candidatus Thiodictyon syntrophicum]AUB80055.1 hypothetical protein THSYN_03135 [Candidatus Thiodictyon syntrophicum]
MDKTQFRSLALVGPLAILAIVAGCSPQPDGELKLQAGDEARPEVILRKFRLGTDDADRWLAQAVYDDGLAVMNRQVAPELRWGPAYKAFCYSAQLHPTAQSLWHCADVLVGSAQGMTGPEAPALRRAVLWRIAMLFTSALVLDQFDRGLTTEQRAQAQRDRDCIADYLSDHHGYRPRCGTAALLIDQAE